MSISAQEETKIFSVASAGLLPVGTASGVTPWAQTYDRRLAISSAYAPTSQRLELTSIWLPGGAIVTAITFESGAQAEASGSHLWYALYRGDNRALLAQTADQTATAAHAASTALRLTLSSPVVLPYTGMYYLGYMCQATTVATLLNITSGVTGNLGAVSGMTPILAGYADTSLAASAPNPCASLTTITQCLYAFVD